MALKKLKPITPGQRGRIAPGFSDVTTDKPEKSLLAPLHKKGGRNAQGRMTIRNVGGGHKRHYRIIDFKRDKFNIPGTVKTIEYDPNRTARIALVVYADGEKRYMLAPQGLKVGQEVMSGDKAAPEVGNTLTLDRMPIGTVIHNIELHPSKGGILARSAGNFAQLLARDGKHAIVKLPSGETRRVLVTCQATVGAISNAEHLNERLGKAGRNRWKGRRPRVRGVAMNPVDHPMGGGEGRASGGHPRSRTGLYAKGQKTRRPNRYSDILIISRKNKNKR